MILPTGARIYNVSRTVFKASPNGKLFLLGSCGISAPAHIIVIFGQYICPVKKRINSISKLLPALLLCLLFYAPAHGNTIAHCDTLIQRGIDAMWKKDHVKSLELLTQARNLAAKNKWYMQQFRAINNIGANYYNMLDYGEALNYYLESYTIAVKELEPTQEMVVLNNIAIVYSKEKDYNKARYYFKKAYDIAKENNDRIKIGLYAMNLGNLANETGRYAEARKYIVESFPFMKDDPKMNLLAEIALAENNLQTGNATQARQKAESLYRTAADLDFNDTGTSLQLIIIKGYLKEDNPDPALAHAKKLLAAKPNAETRKNVFGLMAKAYAKKGAYAEALQYKDSVIAATEELEETKNKALLKNNEVRFEVQDYKNRLKINEEKSANERELFYYLFAVSIAIVTIVILILRNRAAKHRQKKLIAERNQKITALELEKERNDNLLLEKQITEKETSSLLEQERLKNEIEARNRKLSAKALYLSGRNELIEEIITSLSKIPGLANDRALAAHIKTLKEHLKTEDEWDSFITHFEEVNHGFLTRLKGLHPSLNANDIRFIAYIYMNLSTKEIASMLNVTPEACRKRKERLADKMALPANVLLYDYLATI